MSEEQEKHIAELSAEKESLEQSHPLAAKLIGNEIQRLQSGGDFNFIELHQTKTKVEYRVKIPIKEFPQVNFVGKILGQGGENVRRLQEATGCRIAVLGRGSMKDRTKAEQLRQQGGKYAHLNHDLHVWLEAVGHPLDCYQRIFNAFRLVHPFLVPDPNEMEQMQQQQQQQQQQANGGMMRGAPGGRGGPRGRGAPRGAPMGRGAPRGGGMGRGGAPMMGAGGGMAGGFPGPRPPMRGGAMGARGAPRGQMPGRGGPRGAPMGRGGAPGMRGRGAAAAPSMLQQQSAAQGYQQESYDYGSGATGYGAGYGDQAAASYEDPSAGGYGTAVAEASDPYQYDAYGSAEDTTASYGAGAYDASGWGGETAAGAAGYGKAAAPSRGGLTNYRTRPY